MRSRRTGHVALFLDIGLLTQIGQVHSEQATAARVSTGFVQSELTLASRTARVSFAPALRADDPAHRTLLSPASNVSGSRRSRATPPCTSAVSSSRRIPRRCYATICGWSEAGALGSSESRRTKVSAPLNRPQPRERCRWCIPSAPRRRRRSQRRWSRPTRTLDGSSSSGDSISGRSTFGSETHLHQLSREHPGREIVEHVRTIPVLSLAPRRSRSATKQG